MLREVMRSEMVEEQHVTLFQCRRPGSQSCNARGCDAWWRLTRSTSHCVRIAWHHVRHRGATATSRAALGLLLVRADTSCPFHFVKLAEAA